jgi:hypothetical protein
MKIKREGGRRAQRDRSWIYSDHTNTSRNRKPSLETNNTAKSYKSTPQRPQKTTQTHPIAQKHTNQSSTTPLQPTQSRTNTNEAVRAKKTTKQIAKENKQFRKNKNKPRKTCIVPQTI